MNQYIKTNETTGSEMKKNERLKFRFSIVILVLITLPVVIHTRSLLLKITQVEAHWILLEVYAWFFAIAFDCSIFMFAIFQKREQAIAFAAISGVVGWLFWCGDLVFVEWWKVGANKGELWSRLVMGTLWAISSAYLVFWCSEVVAEMVGAVSKGPASIIATARRPGETKKVSRSKSKKQSATVGISTREIAFDADLVSRAKKLRGEGLSVREVATHLGISKSKVGKWNKEQLI